ncbi:hypothetical protein Nepgr_032296 [Nepenthes gracilis]|uniref:Uncharacterized protein n=1 Tax=Nepenthes gracilis TaxID=150966 RepID=A0AAD3TIB9_NEPGR|nr:hypothetical protein Nepgr_032296 [Nepenthes gracilis]
MLTIWWISRLRRCRYAGCGEAERLKMLNLYASLASIFVEASICGLVFGLWEAAPFFVALLSYRGGLDVYSVGFLGRSC